MSRRQVFEELAMRGLGGLSPAKAAQVLVDLVEQLRSVEPGLLARYEVHPAATRLRDALVEALVR